MAITITVIRDDEEIEVEAEGKFYLGDLEKYTITPNIQLTEAEDTRIVDLLVEEYNDDWDENSWKTERESSCHV